MADTIVGQYSPTDEVFRFTDFTNTIADSFTNVQQGEIGGVGVGTGENLRTTDWNTDLCVEWVGFSSTVNSSFTAAGGHGLTGSGSESADNFQSSGFNADTLHRYTGFTSTILGSFTPTAIGDLEGSTVDGSDNSVIVADTTPFTVNQQTGFTNTVLATFDIGGSAGRHWGVGITPAGNPMAPAANGANVDIHKFTGFTPTVSAQFSTSISLSPGGVEDFDYAGRFAAAGPSFSLTIRRGQGIQLL